VSQKSRIGSPESFNRRELMILRAYQVRSYLGEKWLRWRYSGRVRFGEGCRIDPGTFILRGLGRLEMGDRVIIERGIHKVLFNLEPESRVRIGEGTWFQTFNDDLVFSCKTGAEITLGNNCWFSGGLYGASERITIGDHTLIGYGCMILDSDLHQLDNDSQLETAPITIGSHVWIPSHTIVLKGVTIGDHCVIATGSLVTQDIPDHSLAAGRPAKVIKKIKDRHNVP
jgi:acetyltransferase-like isoleucine patch superfamily enzyme